MKRLLYIGNMLEARGGAPTSIDILPDLLERECFRIKKASARKNKILRLLEMQWLLLRNFRRTELVLIDTYSTQNFWYAVVSGSLCRILGLSYILILHGGKLTERLKNAPRTSGRLFSMAFCNIAPSTYLYEGFNRSGIENLRYIPNFIKLEGYNFKARENPRPRLLWVRAFDEIYNPMLALKVLEDLVKVYPDAELCMVGPQKDESIKKCRNYAEYRDLPVKFTGKLRKERWTKLAEDYDIFLNTTNVDNTPVSVIEAMALGLPVVSTRVGGMPFLIEDQKNGLLVPPSDEKAMSRAVQRLIEDGEKSLRMSKAARKKAETFDWSRVKEEWLQLLNQKFYL